MYHIRQTIKFSSPSAVILPEMQVNENGQVDYKQVDQSKKVLPDVETTDLRALLDAGVSLKQVNTKLFGPSGIVTDMSEEPKQNQQGVNSDEE